MGVNSLKAEAEEGRAMNTQNEAGTGAGATHRVLVLGAGYAGMAAAVQLAARTARREDVTVTVVDAHERFTERMRLHMTATGQRLAELSVPELLEGTGARFVRGWVTAVDADARAVRIDDDRSLHYDTLVYALGSVADTATVPGVEDHAYALNSTQDAEVLAERLARLGGGTVVVGGNGPTGIESAAEIAERHPELDVVLLGRQEPGAALHPKARAYVRAALGRLGVRIRSGTDVVKVRPGAVETADGDSVPADVVLWTGGTRVSPMAAAAGRPSTNAAVSSPTEHCGRCPTRTCTRWATLRRSARATGSCTVPARAACPPESTPRCRSCAHCGARSRSRSDSASTTRR